MSEEDMYEDKYLESLYEDKFEIGYQIDDQIDCADCGYIYIDCECEKYYGE
jgi:hypothetical protein